MMKFLKENFLMIIVGAAALVYGGNLLVNSATYLIRPSRTEENIKNDIMNKWVELRPQGHLWAFSEDQKIKLKAVDSEQNDEFYTIFVEVDALAIVPASQVKSLEMKETKEETSDSKIRLTGLAALKYKRIASKWRLINVESLDLSISPSN